MRLGVLLKQQKYVLCEVGDNATLREAIQQLVKRRQTILKSFTVEADIAHKRSTTEL